MKVLHGDCLAILPTLEANSIDAIVTDAPYHLISAKQTAYPNTTQMDSPHRRVQKGFMNTEWDGGDIAFRPDVWRECLRVLKPGGYMVAFGGCRTYHRLATAIEDAGFVIHPMLAWAFGTGFPKATNASKMIDKHLGAEREVVGTNLNARESITGYKTDGRTTIHALSDDRITAPATPEAAQWEGWSYGLQSLKPALEPICMAQKPMIGTGAQNILAWGVGAVNIDASRVPAEHHNSPKLILGNGSKDKCDSWGRPYETGGRVYTDAGRWPPNLLHDGSPEVTECFPQTKTGDIKPYQGEPGSRAGLFDGGWGDKRDTHHKGDTGSAARFFPQLGFSDDERRLHSIHSLLSEHEIVILDVCNAKTAVTQLHQDQEGVSDPFVHKNARDGTSHNNAASSHQSPKNVQVADYSLRRLPAVIVSSAQTNAGELDAANNAQHAKSAAKQYDSCETNIAPSTAPIRIESMADFLAPFINATQNESALIIDTLIAMIHMCESVPWPKQEPDVLSLSRNHVKGVANLMPCGTMTIMISLSISDGSVQNATYSITPRNTDHGGRDCGQRIRYHPKASKRDRAGSKHPCVKPLKLMEWLCRLITPPGGTILDPFAGSGTTGQAAMNLGFDAILIEREDAYVADIQRRMGQSDSVFKFVTR